VRDCRIHTFTHSQAYERYVANNPHNESRFVYPVEEGAWLDPENGEFVAKSATEITLRDHAKPLPPTEEYEKLGITLEGGPVVRVYELCRFLADVSREAVLATPEERRVSILPEMTQILQLEEWNHPNVVDDRDRPSGSETFQQLAEILVTGDVGLYRPSRTPNTHWRNWPAGGTL
jgi:uncharacterized protein DUF7003